MKLLSIPRTFLLNLLSLWICLPLGCLQIYLWTEGLLASFPLLLILMSVLLAVSVSFFRFQKLSLTIVRGMFLCWVLLSFVSAVKHQMPSFFFFCILLVGCLGIILAGLLYEFQKSYFGPILSWYQKLPKPMPHLLCHITLGDERTSFRVAKLDAAGAYLFSEEPASARWTSNKKLPLSFSFRGRHWSINGSPTTLSNDASGHGFQFETSSADQKKEIFELMELLGAEGYLVTK